MVEVSFYHLQREPLDVALPKLLEKVYERSLKTVLIAGSNERVEALNDRLWTYRKESFLPHGGPSDGNAAAQPIYLTTKEENPNGATILVMVDGVDPAFKGDFDRCLDMFDGNDEDAVAAARERWKADKAAGHEVTYWQQGERGWEKKA